MSGYRVGEQVSLPCPYCGTQTEAEWESFGVNQYVQVGPYRCESCGAVEIGRYDHNEDYPFSKDEKRTGWYKPGHMMEEMIEMMSSMRR